jgi:hypothetical protein
MQIHHFGYQGRHKFLLSLLSRYLTNASQPLSAIDLGGGVGGWLSCLNKHRQNIFFSPSRFFYASSSHRRISFAAIGKTLLDLSNEYTYRQGIGFGFFTRRS